MPVVSGVQAAGNLSAIRDPGRLPPRNGSLPAERHHQPAAALRERCAAAAVHRLHTHAQDQSQVRHQLQVTGQLKPFSCEIIQKAKQANTPANFHFTDFVIYIYIRV